MCVSYLCECVEVTHVSSAVSHHSFSQFAPERNSGKDELLLSLCVSSSQWETQQIYCASETV